MLKISENNGTEEIGLVTPTPDMVWPSFFVISRPLHQTAYVRYDANVHSYARIITHSVEHAHNYLEE